MNIELKNVRHADSLSQETLCFSATLYIDGARRGVVSNSGRGGAHDYEPFGLSDEIQQHAVTLPMEDGIKQDADWLVTKALLNSLAARDLRAALRNRLIWVSSDGLVRESDKVTPDRLRAILQRPEDSVRAEMKRDVVRLLNYMPFDEALAIFRAATERKTVRP